MHTTRSLSIGRASGAALALTTALAAGCGGGGTKDQTPKPALLSMLVVAPAAGSTSTCGTLTGSYQLDPKGLTGSVGEDHTITRSFDVAGNETGAGSSRQCRYTVDVTSFTPGLRAGTWTLAIRTSAWAASCTETLRVGYNLKTFDLNRAGCR